MSNNKSTPKKSGPKSETKAETKSSEMSSTIPSAPDTGGKSAKESVGGASVGHYGFFSNIKTPEYKSGWDDIWGGKEKPLSVKKKDRAKPKSSVLISLDFDDLSEELREGLSDAVRAQLRKKRISYDARAKKGDVDWTIDCEVRR